MNILHKYIKEAVRDFDTGSNEPDYFNQEQDSVEDLVNKISAKFKEIPEEELESHKEELKRLLMMLRSL